VSICAKVNVKSYCEYGRVEEVIFSEVMSLRPGAVNFHEKWEELSQTILAVVKLSPVNTVTWNDHYS